MRKSTHRRNNALSIQAVGWVGLCLAMMTGCRPKPAPSGAEVPPAPPEARKIDPTLATLQLASERLRNHAPEEALVWLEEVLHAAPGNETARQRALEILASTTFHLPRFSLEHGLAIEQIHGGSSSSMWVSLTGTENTTVRWNLETGKIETVLFPIAKGPTRYLISDPGQQWIVVGRAETNLLCDAKSLKPIRDLGRLPHGVDPAAVITFSPDGLLLAHPSRGTDEAPGIVWHLRDSRTGEIVRSSHPIAPATATSLAGHLGPERLEILLDDGSLIHVPVSPMSPVTRTPQAEPIRLRHAQFTSGGNAVFALMDQGTHEPPGQVMMDFTGNEAPTPTPLELLEKHPWHPHPSAWTGLMRDAEATLQVDGASLRFPGSAPIAGIRAEAEITSVARVSGELLVGTRAGSLTFHRALPPLERRPSTATSAQGRDRQLEAFGKAVVFLSGLKTGKDGLETVPGAERIEALKSCDFTAIGGLFPELDFKSWQDFSTSFQPESAVPDALAALSERLVRARAKPSFPTIEEAFANADAEQVRKCIAEAGGKGPAAALALQLALGSTHPEWIAAALESAVDLPAFLKRIAVSRIAWLEGRKADAISGWPDTFPDYSLIRQREDWDGWEAADFAPALEGLRLCVGEELAKLELPENAGEAERKALFAHLSDPSTLQAVGKARFAKACLRAALAFSSIKEETVATFKLASLARDLGEEPAPCLRAEAMSLTALGDYQTARDRWIELISNHPVATHEPGDYAEAAYTSFENADPRQAMAILTTGIHRFPNDANFALRAGWVALLTGNSERAYRFLLTGRQIGYPEDKLENATALMAIAAVQSGATEDANVFYQDLMRMDQAWENPETIETLEWPEELKASLRQLAW